MFLAPLIAALVAARDPAEVPQRLLFVTNAYAKVHPTENKIVYQSNAGGDFDLYVSDGDGVTTKRIVSTPGNDITPEYSPDGKKLAFVSDRDGNREVYVCNSDGGGQVNITANPAMDIHPSWSADGRRLLFSSNRGNTDPEDYDIYLMNADGGEPRRITSGPAIDTYASFSPDGKRIVTRRVIDGNNEVFVMNADGSDPKNLTNAKDSYDGWPVWSPDGKRIAYASGPGGKSPTRIMLMDADGSNKRELTSAPLGTTFVYDTQPTFTPSGKRIVFTRYRDFEVRESSELCVIQVPLA